MFEQFTAAAQQVIVRAQQDARNLGHYYIGTEHLLLALLDDAAGVARRSLDRLGVERDAVRADIVRIIGEGPHDSEQEDAAALRAIGIDLDEVRRRAEEAFGPGALERLRAPRRGQLGPSRRGWRRRVDPCGSTRASATFGWDPTPAPMRLTPRAKKVLELARREALVLQHRFVGPEHILLGLVREGEGVAVAILSARRAQASRVRRAVMEELSRPDDLQGNSGS
jgi:ATP-dependent Clp protease ATP-binding subunit ClpA